MIAGMKEYRIMAYFKKVYDPRSYKRKMFGSREEAENMLPEAIRYYSGYKYYDLMERVVIESREVGDWKE